jgi:hypothetical protein
LDLVSSIIDAHLLTDIFGRWPSLHDAEVVSLHLDRKGEWGPSLTVAIHLSRTLDEKDDRGYFRQTDHTLVRLRFEGVVLESLSGINHQNVLQSLEIVDYADHPFEAPLDEFPQRLEVLKFRVFLHHCYGLSGSLGCRSIQVVSAEPMPDELLLG